MSANRLQELITGFGGRRVLLYGDLVADVFTFGEISRISREAPILILEHRRTRIVPGGGANAVNNLAAMGCRVTPVSVVGDDEYGKALCDIFEGQGISLDGIVRVPGYATPSKTRISAGSRHVKRQQVVRIDRVEAFRHDDDSRRRVSESLQQMLSEADAVIISDYGLGAVEHDLAREMIESARRQGVPVTIDSRRDLLAFSGVNAATPNEPELEALFGENVDGDTEKVFEFGRRLRERLGAEAILVTRGGQGMVLVEGDRRPEVVEIYGTGEVADVTGAGDTVIAAFTLALAAGGSYREAALISNYAGGIVVMKWSTAVVTADELIEAVRRDAGY